MALGVCVLLPTYNRAALIGETLDSLFAQTRPVDQVIVIDDGSTDSTPQVLAGYGDRLTVLRKPNGGKSTALNLGMSLATQDCIWVLDDDDLLLPDACAVLMGALEADDGLDFCAGRHEDFTTGPDGTPGPRRVPGYTRLSAPDEILPDLLDGCHVFQPGLIVRRRVYDAVGPFRTDLIRSQDYDMTLRIARGHHGRVLEQTVFLHREHEGDRGAAGQRFAADKRADQWAAYNRRIFAPLLADLSDAEVLPTAIWARTSAGQRPRLASVKRACVMARQRMWSEAIVEWRRAAAMGRDPLSADERMILERSTTSPLGFPELFTDAGVQQGLLELSRQGPVGRQIVRRIAWQTKWRLRQAAAQRDWAMVGRVLRMQALAFGLARPLPATAAQV